MAKKKDNTLVLVAVGAGLLYWWNKKKQTSVDTSIPNGSTTAAPTIPPANGAPPQLVRPDSSSTRASLTKWGGGNTNPLETITV